MPNPAHIAGLRIDPRPVGAESTRRAQTRRRIAEAAAEAFAELGYAETTIEAVAARAHVSPRTVYRHFGSKGALSAAVFAVSVADYLVRVSHLVDGGTGLRLSLESAARIGFSGLTESPGSVMAVAVDEGELRGQWLWAAHRQHEVLARILCRAHGRPVAEATSPQWRFRAGALLNAIVTAHELWIEAPDRIELVELLVQAVATIAPILGDTVAAEAATR